MYLGLKLKYGMLTIKVKTSKEFSFFWWETKHGAFGWQSKRKPRLNIQDCLLKYSYKYTDQDGRDHRAVNQGRQGSITSTYHKSHFVLQISWLPKIGSVFKICVWISVFRRKKQFVNPLHGLKVKTILGIQENSGGFF